MVHSFSSLSLMSPNIICTFCQHLHYIFKMKFYVTLRRGWWTVLTWNVYSCKNWLVMIKYHYASCVLLKYQAFHFNMLTMSFSSHLTYFWLLQNWNQYQIEQLKSIIWMNKNDSKSKKIMKTSKNKTTITVSWAISEFVWKMDNLKIIKKYIWKWCKYHTNIQIWW